MAIQYDNTLIKNKYLNELDKPSTFMGLSYCTNTDLTKYSNTLLISDEYAELLKKSATLNYYSVKLKSVTNKNINSIAYKTTTSTSPISNSIVSFTQGYFYNNTSNIYELTDYDTTDFVFTASFGVYEKGSSPYYQGTKVNKELHELQNTDIINDCVINSWSLNPSTGKYTKQNQLILGKYALDGFVYGNNIINPRSISYNPKSSAFSGSVSALNIGIPYKTYSIHDNTTKYRNCYIYYTNTYADNNVNVSRDVKTGTNYVHIATSDSDTSRSIVQYKTGKLVLEHFASYGVYFVPSDIRATVTKNDLVNGSDSRIMLGYMGENRETNGTFVKGSNIPLSKTVNRQGQISDIPYIQSVEYKDMIDKNSLIIPPSSAAALGRLYCMSAGQIAELSGVMNGTIHIEGHEVPENFDFLKNIISVYKLPFAYNSDFLTTAFTPDTVKINGFDSGVSAYKAGIGQEYFSVIGSITIPRKHNNFLDFAPYTVISMHIPFFGDIELNTELCYTTLTVRLIYNLNSADFRVCVYTDDNICIADISKNLAASCVLSENDFYIRQAAIKSAEINTITGLATTTASVLSGDVLSSSMGILSTVKNLENIKNTENANMTIKTGVTGSGTGWNDVDMCYVMITTPFEKEQTYYNKTYGYACNVYGKIENLSGYSVFDNVKLDFNATSEELQMIKNALESGVYL